MILEAVRTPFTRRQGAFREERPDALPARVLTGLVDIWNASPTTDRLG